MAGTREVAISHLQRRKIEGRVLIPFLQTLREQLGENAMREVLDATIRKLAADDGAAWAEPTEEPRRHCERSPKSCGRAAALWMFRLSASLMSISTST